MSEEEEEEEELSCFFRGSGRKGVGGSRSEKKKK